MADTQPTIIITRAMPGAAETEAHLREQRLNVVTAPMLSLETVPTPSLPSAASLSGLVFTSANGVRTYANTREDRDLTAWCVGPATARAARDTGFTDIRESAGNAADLVNFIAAPVSAVRLPPLTRRKRGCGRKSKAGA